MNQQFNNPPARVLVVDDQESNRKSVGDILDQLGFEIVLSTSGDEALRQMELQPVDLVLLDVRMPGRDGLEVCRMIRQQPEWNTIPVIFLSVADDKDLIVRALEVGGVDYVIKPFHRAELISRVRTHLALKNAHDRLKQLAADKDELLGILAHDLKNHLGGMQMTARLLAERAKSYTDSRLERMTNNVLQSTEQMYAFVQEFLANASADRGLKLTTDTVVLDQAVAGVVEQYAEIAARKAITLQYAGGGDTVVTADREALRQVLANLVSNAIKFSETGTTVRVDVSASGGGATVRVRDEGPGFSDEDKTFLFHRYRRLSARPTAGESSTGLGLSIVKKLVQAMHGEIRCESILGKGTTFVVILPGPEPSAT